MAADAIGQPPIRSQCSIGVKVSDFNTEKALRR